MLEQQCEGRLSSWPYCVKKLSMAGFCEDKGEFEVPSLILKLGTTLKKCCTIKQGHAIEKEDTASGDHASAFRQLMEFNWTDEVSRSALRGLRHSKLNNPKTLPTTEEIIKMSREVQKKAQRCSPPSLLLIQPQTLSMTFVFWRKRPLYRLC
jgi:hypothetical protein